jgi:hypothetical protein
MAWDLTILAAATMPMAASTDRLFGPTIQIIGVAFRIRMGSERPVIAVRISTQVQISGIIEVQVLPLPVWRIQAVQAAEPQTDGTASPDAAPASVHFHQEARGNSNPPTERLEAMIAVGLVAPPTGQVSHLTAVVGKTSASRARCLSETPLPSGDLRSHRLASRLRGCHRSISPSSHPGRSNAFSPSHPSQSSIFQRRGFRHRIPRPRADPPTFPYRIARAEAIQVRAVTNTKHLVGTIQYRRRSE